MKPDETLQKAYGNVPKEVGFTANFDFITWRGFKYYWYKLLRKVIR